MGIIRDGLKSVVKKALLVALVYGGKKAAEKLAGKAVDAVAKKKNGEK